MSIWAKLFPPPVDGAKPCENCGRVPRSAWEQRQQATCYLCGRLLCCDCFSNTPCPSGAVDDPSHQEDAQGQLGFR